MVRAMLSLLGHRWVMPQTGWREAAALSQQTGLSPLVCQLMAAGGIITPAMASDHLSPNLKNLPNPNLMPDVIPAVARLKKAIKEGEALCIFGDYDVDGTCATALAMRYFACLGITPLTYVPDRLTEGYGPNPKAMQSIAAKGVKLVITVDTGTMAHEALEAARQAGLDVLVTDHHPPHAGRPPCVALVNPHAGSAPEELTPLCGTGVLFYLLMALNTSLREDGYFSENQPEPKLTKWLDLVALATVADVMQLVGVNRILVAKGLAQMGRWGNAGLSALAQVAGVSGAPSAYTLGFQLGPRINAAGRIESATLAQNLLQTEDAYAAAAAAEKLNELNKERQELEKQALAEALQQAEEMMKENPSVLMVQGAWHPGVVGLVASRVKEKFYRPTFAFAWAKDDAGTPLLKGSARSVDGIDLGAAVAAAHTHTLSGGGHAMAAGVTLLRDKLGAFAEMVTKNIHTQIGTQDELLIPRLKVAATLPAAGVTMQLGEELSKLEPYGMGNPEPVLAVTGAQISYAKAVGATQDHIKFRLTSGAEGIAFGAGNTPLGAALTQSAGKPLTLAVKLRPNTFNGRTTLDMHLQDIHPSFSPSSNT
ncbi:MAG: single-stranded-DNA-specific exonuclease RecJ [Alphaproteobacteria bacterium CG_4_10_14_0_8_um_filter_53_9]|nr:MAG: single-stranded-DNA-specific exonuclease RecJ [Alphaproteobacteria bacterium CG_4_10_14_0_8_um_filter_53_9]